jgi:hypothetical protein
MATRIIRSIEDAGKLAQFIAAQPKFPMLVTITQGDPRRPAQNRLAQRWFADIARQLGDQDREAVRAECKMLFGVPILRAENEAFRAEYDAMLRPLSYEAKLRAIRVFDIPVTRMMTTKQMTEFMDAMQQHWSSMGVRLTDPEALKYEEEFA